MTDRLPIKNTHLGQLGSLALQIIRPTNQQVDPEATKTGRAYPGPLAINQLGHSPSKKLGLSATMPVLLAIKTIGLSGQQNKPTRATAQKE